ncbi:unnamed protein product [Rhizoctonia solani]|uniref:DUF6535 domain-containing protein n=1 Tax=Rhizoctonia solani TaxID=456999 RepID=A0A8H3CPE0_9AGAM|nr:unnamed protein product [Rhizoctonia solani]
MDKDLDNDSSECMYASICYVLMVFVYRMKAEGEWVMTELDADAQVWETYVQETSQVDRELVDGWNKSMDVILSEFHYSRCFQAALFLAISTVFVIKSYKNLKQDSADLSAQTLLTISWMLAVIANGSQSPGAQSSCRRHGLYLQGLATSKEIRADPWD